MPASSDQHITGAIKNPFEEPVSRISQFTAIQIATLQSRLDKQLGPEYISTRAGPGGGRVHYLAAEKVINLANEVFGFNGWSSSIQKSEIDFVDVAENSNKVTLGMAVIVRVTLRDGTYHEDIGYGHIENCRGKAAAFEKARKEAVTDALKRALRSFGKVLGNCLYDKDYLAKVTKIKVPPGKWDEANLHRHPDYAPAKRGGSTEPKPLDSQPDHQSDLRSESLHSEVEDDFGGGNLFDGVELPAGQNDPSDAPQPQDRNQLPPHHQASAHRTHQRPNGPHRHASMPAAAQTSPQSYQETHMGPPGPPGGLNQPQNPRANPSAITPTTDQINSTGFVTSRAAAASSTDEPLSDRQLISLPRFNPNLESPSIKRTPGVDHSKSARVERAAVGAPPGPRTIAEQTNGQAPRGPAPPASITAPAPAPITKAQAQTPNFVNPAADPGRKIGMPVQRNGSPYRPPTGVGVKRPLPSDAHGARPPLADVSNAAAGAKGVQQAAVNIEGGKVERLEEAVAKRTRLSSGVQ